MAQTKKKQHRKKQGLSGSTTWILAGVVAAMMIIIAVLLLVSRQEETPEQQAFDPDFEPEVSGAPRVEVLPEEVIDYGDVELDVPINTVFKVRNVGDEPLVLQGEPQVELVEGC